MNNKRHCCFIINSIIPYRYDLNQIVALPSGCNYRNRWAEQWVDPSLRDNIEQLKFNDVLILLRDYDEDRLIPVRWGKLYLSQRIGSIFYFEYELCNIIRYSNDKDTRNAQIDAFNHKFHELHPESRSAPNDGIKPSVFLSQVGFELESTHFDDFDNWGHVVNAIGGVKAYEGVEFLKIIETASLDRGIANISNRHYELRPNTVYEMRLFQLIPNPGDEKLEPHDIQLKTSHGQISVLREIQRAVGKYDMLRFVFKVEDLKHEESSFIELLHKPHPTSSSFALPSLYIPVVIKRGWRITNIFRVLVTAVTLFFTFSPDALGLIEFDTEWVRSLALILFIITIVGWRRIWDTFWR